MKTKEDVEKFVEENRDLFNKLRRLSSWKRLSMYAYCIRNESISFMQVIPRQERVDLVQEAHPLHDLQQLLHGQPLRSGGEDRIGRAVEPPEKLGGPVVLVAVDGHPVHLPLRLFIGLGLALPVRFELVVISVNGQVQHRRHRFAILPPQEVALAAFVSAAVG